MTNLTMNSILPDGGGGDGNGDFVEVDGLSSGMS